MTSLKRDDNRIAVIGGVSSTDLVTVVPIAVDPTTNAVLVQLALTTGSGVPATTPSVIGAIYIDTSATKVYMATGVSSSSDWTALN